ncbi:MAG: choice-of-anchor R domain-containing protein [Steroidobacteraceae bacterium]
MTLSWLPPTAYTDGTPMTELAGYHIHYGTAPRDYPSTIQIANPGIANYVVQGLAPGTYYFAVSAYDSSGAESQYSQELTLTLTGASASTGTGASTAATTSTGTIASTTAGSSSGIVAAAPAISCAALGTTLGTTLGTSSSPASAAVDAGDENTMSGSPITVGGESISVSAITVWISSAEAAPNNRFEVAIYTDNGGQPGSLVVASSAGTITPQSWNIVPLSATLNANTRYWLLYDTNATVPSLNEMSLSASSTSTGWYSGMPGSAPFGTWPKTASAGHLQSPQQTYSIYVTYQSASDTLGSKTATPPATVDGGDENTMAGSPVTTGAQAVSVSSIAVWINSAQAAPNNQFEVAIYTDSAGKPGSLLAASNAQSISPQSWNTVPLSVVLKAGTTYWLLYNTNATVPTSNEMSISPSTSVTSWYSGNPGSATFGTWPLSAPAGHLQSPAQLYSIDLNYP